ncbi:AAA family ATPase, partial [uncultured Sphingomonas sp.]|uniref:AAA family ATPase n=1 Tax=uncultured Sphingomonas sp. TaxID=158754 RepID=UPI0025EE6B91
MTDIPNTQPDSRDTTILEAPDKEVSVRDLFGIDIDMKVPAFSEADERVPDLDPAYVFDADTTLAILAGFAHNRRVMVQGYHGTGKSTHIEQVAARLNWPCIRINLDAHISRIDLIGRDAIVLKDGQQVTEFREGLLPWALQTPTALVFDEYDAGRPDVMFVIQRVLETEGKLTLLDQNRVIRPNPWFRLFATANTVGLGDTSGLYHGTQQIVQADDDVPAVHLALIDLLRAVIQPAGVAQADRVGGREQAEPRIRTNHPVLVEQGQFPFRLQHALDHEHHIGAARIIFVEDERGRGLERPGEQPLAELGHLLPVLQDDGVAA